MKHSRLPWNMLTDRFGVYEIESADRNPIIETDELSHADAQFIVHAVNNHYRLLEALKELTEAEWMVSHDWGGDRESALEKAREAIKQAEEV